MGYLKGGVPKDWVSQGWGCHGNRMSQFLGTQGMGCFGEGTLQHLGTTMRGSFGDGVPGDGMPQFLGTHEDGTPQQLGTAVGGTGAVWGCHGKRMPQVPQGWGHIRDGTPQSLGTVVTGCPGNGVTEMKVGTAATTGPL